MLSALLFALVIGQSAAAAPANRAQPSAYVVAMTYNPVTNRLPTVMVKLDDGPPLRFMVDTGWPNPVSLDERAAKRLGIKLPDVPRKQPQDPLSGRFITVRKAQLLGRTGEVALVVAGPVNVLTTRLDIPAELYEGAPVVGVLGSGFFSIAPARFDFAAGTLTFFGDGQAHAGPDAVRIPVASNLRPGDPRVTVTATLPTGNTTELVVDTAADPSVLRPHDVALLPATAPGKEIPAWTAYGVKIYHMALVPSLAIGPLQVTEFAACVDTDATSANLPGFLGLDVLARYRVTLDYANRAMYLEKAADYTERSRLPGGEIVLLDPRLRKPTVAMVSPDSAADRAGVRRGDRILMVDGRQIDGLVTGAVQQAVDGFTGTEAALTVLRGGKQLTLRYTRPPVVEPAPTVGLGIEVFIADTGAITITDVHPGSPSSVKYPVLH